MHFNFLESSFFKKTKSWSQEVLMKASSTALAFAIVGLGAVSVYAAFPEPTQGPADGVHNNGGIRMSIFRESGTFTVPIGVTKIKATAYGGGGSTYRFYNGGNSLSGGGGGWGSALLEVTPGEEIPFVVGEAAKIPAWTDREYNGQVGTTLAGTSSIKGLSATGGASSYDYRYASADGGTYSGGYIGGNGYNGVRYADHIADLSLKGGATTGPYGSLGKASWKDGFGTGSAYSNVNTGMKGSDGAVIIEW